MIVIHLAIRVLGRLPIGRQSHTLWFGRGRGRGRRWLLGLLRGDAWLKGGDLVLDVHQTGDGFQSRKAFQRVHDFFRLFGRGNKDKYM